MPDRKHKPEKETPHKDKLCKTCGRPFAWRKEWEKDWDVMKYCNDACRGYKAGEADAAVEAAKLVGGDETRRDWEGLMQPVRAAARRLVKAGRIDIVQNGRVVDGATAKGAIRLRLRSG